MKQTILLFLLSLAALCAPAQQAWPPLDYSDSLLWYVTERSGDADIFYVTSTETADWVQPLTGQLCHQADVYNINHRKAMLREMRGVERRLAGDCSFFAPYYRQCTMQTWGSQALVSQGLPLALADVRQAFDYYLRHLNHGRPIVLAGYSQGGFALIDLLKHMPDSVVPRIVAAYVIGARVTQADLDGYPDRIRLARGADDTGVVVAFNSVRSPECAIPIVSEGTVACINPLNWRTDATPARLDSLTVRVDPASHLLLVDGVTDHNYLLPVIGREGNYHSREIIYFGRSVGSNIATRVEAYRQQHGLAPARRPWARSVRQKLTALLASPLFQTSQVSLMVYDLTADTVVFCHNERQLMRPASIMKNVTAIAALERLGGDYCFRTQLVCQGRVEQRTLRGNLVCVGGFDPLFDNDDLDAFVESVLRLGIDTILGRVVADKSMKDTLVWGEGWCWDDKNPTLSPLLLNRKEQLTERLAARLAARGVVLADSLPASLPKGAARTHVCTRFHTMDQVLQPMLKESDNLLAESMLYQLAASGGQRPARARQGHALVKQLIKRLGLDAQNYRFADGCGLSLYNYQTAELQVALLRYARQQSDISSHLLPALPVAGRDGTLKERMRGTAAEARVRAKTGSLTGVSTLAGYATAANGHELCFAIMNQGVQRMAPARSFQDSVCIALCEEP